MDPRRCLSHGSTIVTSISILLLLQAQPQAQNLGTEEHFFGPFSSSDIDTNFHVIPMASINYGALQLSPVITTLQHLITDKSGRVFFNKPFKIWEEDDHNFNGRVASFNTSFLFNVLRVNNATPGEGLAFLIAPSLSIPPLSDGEFLGLTNDLTDGNTTNQIIAVELDTVKQDFDPDDNHIGLDINSVRSDVTVPLSQFGFQIAPNGTQFYVLWVDYDGAKKVIDVYMAAQPDKDAPIVEKPMKPVLTYDLDLKGLVSQMSYFGFSASTGDKYESNTILRWNLSVDVLPESKVRNNGNPLKMGLSIGLPLFLVSIGIGGVVYYICKSIRTRPFDPELSIILKELPGTPREFSYQELKEATNNFDDKNKLGQGGFGAVYRGTLAKENLEVAVKKFLRDKMKSTEDFLAELKTINRLRHKNLVPLLGWCHENQDLLLVYEYMANGSLDKHIFCKEEDEKEEASSTVPLSWNLRYKILVGVTTALNYLHNEYGQGVLHRDLKASNIMLDSDFNARLGDFGLARVLENGKTSYADLEEMPGTMGYIAPECFHTGKATRESDVYGFGAVLLEVVCGKRPYTRIRDYQQFLVDWVWPLHGEGRILEAVDPRLGNNYVVKEAERILKLGLACSHPIASKRPKMQAIVQIISGSVPVPYVPPFKPSFVWPTVDVRSSTLQVTLNNSNRKNATCPNFSIARMAQVVSKYNSL